MQVAVVERLPEPITWTLTGVGLLHPAASVLLPLRPGAAMTIVAAGVVPVPWYDRVTVRWLLSTMLKPVTVTLAMVLAALNDVKVPSWPVSQPSGPAPLKPRPCPLEVLKPFWLDEVVGAAEALARAYAVVPAPRLTSSMTSTRERVETRFLVDSCVSVCDIFLDIEM